MATLARPAPGRILGERYQVREVLGRGGMGEVFRAFDLKLRVEVALKAVRVDRGESDRAREMLRSEVRSAREVVSPNVCRIFDLVVEDGQELVSMEYIDGVTLGETLKTRGPLVLEEAREIASQFLSGLEAIHQAGLVHRDFKPENVMLTRAGRVVVMDFGLAKARAETGTGTISGTPAYMAPEQARGEAVDARADVYAAGMVLAEMLSVGGSGHFEARQALWRGAREVPPRVPDGPWAEVMRQALSPNPEERPATARALARSLEEVTQRLPGFETKRPYPGLSSFTEEDAEYFFGREVEVEAVWRKLKRPRMLALIAPSGAGKSSFLRAGLLPTLPKGWKALIATPGNRPFQALAQALAPAFAGDAQAVQALLRFEEADTAISLLHRFRQRHEHALLIVDQFEELFTLNSPAVQEDFAKLLGRLVLEADFHVILSLRDDFLFRCQDYAALVPAFSDLTPLPTLSESGLRRALVQPALSCGYRFEDESLVDEMVQEVRKERGALPLLAFAASRLWETRDREKGLITRQAYQEIGGVAGALAQHAEATLERIGAQRTPLVREIFRNLVTAQGTRAVRERMELLSVFERGRDGAVALPGAGEERGARAPAEEVLNALVDARLITSYERPGEAGESHHQVEIIHESLLQAWPRLVRWQTQDADGAQLRDQLRQAAQLWHDRGQTEDLLWSGQAYRDLEVWRERYPGGLSAGEEAFAAAATRRAGRRRRQRRIAVAVIVGALSLGLGVVAAFWARAETSRQKAEAEVLRAEASKLLALGQIELDRYPTAAVAFALRSLELADTGEARLFALRALQRGPTATVVPAQGQRQVLAPTFSSNGEWLALGSFTKLQVLHRDGRKAITVGDFPNYGNRWIVSAFGSTGDRIVANQQGDLRAWALPTATEIWRANPDVGPSNLWARGERLFTATTVGSLEVIRQWSTDSGLSRIVGTMEPLSLGDVDRDGHRLAYASKRSVHVRSLEQWSSPPRLLGEHTAEVRAVGFHPDGRQVAAQDQSGEIRIWSSAGSAGRPLRALRADGLSGLAYDPTGRWLAAFGDPANQATVRLWDLAAPPDADPFVLRRPLVDASSGVAFEPTGAFMVAANFIDAAFWPLGARYGRILRGSPEPILSLAFTPDGESLVSLSEAGEVRVWPLRPGSAPGGRLPLRASNLSDATLAIDGTGRLLAVPAEGGGILVAPLAGGAGRRLTGFSRTASVATFAFSEDGRRMAAAPYMGTAEDMVVRVFDLETGLGHVLGPVPGATGVDGHGGTWSIAFQDRDHLLAGTNGVGLVRFDLRDGGAQVMSEGVNVVGGIGRRQGIGIGVQWKSWTARRHQLVRFDLSDARPTVLASHGNLIVERASALDPSETLVASGSYDGTVRVGPVGGGEPHSFFGHEGMVWAVAFSPDGRWLASAGSDKTIRLWPLPDSGTPPFHTLPLQDLLRRLRGVTNLRAVADRATATGYKLEIGPFPGWEKVPEW